MTQGQSLQLGTDHRLVLITLGRAALEYVQRDGPPVELLTPGKPLALLIYLACSPGRSASREHLIDLLWADQGVEAARHSVRQAVWFLRQRLGEQVIAAREGGLALSAPIETDRDAFLDAVQRVDLEQAVERYRGDFLPGFASPGGADFEQWADVERLRLRRLFVRLAETLVRDWVAKGRLRKAMQLAARVRDADRHDETGWRLVLEAHLAAHDLVGAEIEARALEWLLMKTERVAEPATRALLDLARSPSAASTVAPPAPSLSAELIGREREFSVILSAWDAARGGDGRHVHLVAAPGLGKSRLLADAHARVRSAGGLAVLVRANPGERAVPCALASELAAALARLPGAAAVSSASAAALVALNPSLSSCYGAPADRASDLEALRHREIALGELLAAVADEHPVAVMIDDVHWADDDSRQVLSHVLARALAHPVLAVTTARPGAGGAVGRVSGEPLALQPLSTADTGALLASLGRLPLEPWAQRFPEVLNVSARGVPLLILETLHLLLERGTLLLEDGSWTCPDSAALALELARGGALARRIQELERDPRWLLQLLAVAGAPLATGVLARAAGRSPEAVLADLQVLEVRGLVTREGSDAQQVTAQPNAPGAATAILARARAADPSGAGGATREMPLDRAVLDHIPDAIFIADTESRIVAANPAASRLTWYTPAELLRHTLPDLVPREDLAASPPRVAELFAGGALCTERRVRRKGGGLVDVEISWTVLPDGRVLGSARDISERKRHEQQRAERKGRFSAAERRGVVSRAGAEWQPAHDEIAARAVELASAEALRTANDALGRHLAASGRDDPRLLQRAGRHLAAAGDDRELARVFTRRLLLQRRRGERRPGRKVAVELLGDHATPARVSRLVRSLPLYVRLGLVTPYRVAAWTLGVLGIGIGVAAVIFRAAPPPPDATLVLIQQLPGDSLSGIAIPLRREGWDNLTRLDGARLGRPVPALAIRSDRGDATPSPDGATWVYGRTTQDTGDIDLFAVGADHAERRLTTTRGDDDHASWSPDGRRLAFSTTRWSQSRYYDLAIFDVATGRIKRLTFDNGSAAPWWSPDGSRIAFSHEDHRTSPDAPRHNQSCWVTVDGSRRGCVDRSFDVLGWYDAQQILVSLSTPDHPLGRLNLNTGELHVLGASLNGPTEASRDGRWIACFCMRPGTPDRHWYVFPTDRPDLWRRLVIDTESGGLIVRFAPGAERSTYVDRIEIIAPADTVPLHTRYRLQARALDVQGAGVPLAFAEWRSLDTSVARIDDTSGVLTPLRPGSVTIEVSAGGWRQTFQPLTIAATAPQTVFSEDWRGPLETAWIPYGDPVPVIDTGPGGRLAFWNHGDGWYESGAYSRTTFRPGRGLGVEAWWSTPVVGPRQQYVTVTLIPNSDSLALFRWDRHTGSAPLRAASCAFQFPRGDGKPEHPSVDVGAGPVPLPPWIMSGQWYRLRVQVFPDGRCGYALNGTPLGVSDLPVVPLGPAYRVVLHGNSLGNRMLVGPLEVWSGVRDDVDWTALGGHRPATSPRAPPLPSSRPSASPTESHRSAPPQRTPHRRR